MSEDPSLDAFDMLVLTPTSVASTRRVKGGVEIPVSDKNGSYTPVLVAVPKGAFLTPTSIQRGLTISLGDYEFGRIDVGISGWTAPALSEQTYEWASACIEETLLREEASVTKVQRDNVAYPDPPKGLNHVVVSIGYGVTKKGSMSVGARTSIKADVTVTSACTGLSYEDCVATLTERASKMLRAEVKLARGDQKKAPAGF
ncbi:hypothetical protein UFOVP1382_193 [uncultured Caudovirales phage]|uniref:Uncharacterized protein n=1 Tax=uncultured Caudovirales phage TaxID=2100421 RepID=A0A6J5S5C7_9CAUD|nr:hypothetical protein UFOVP1382_193 [uncultured Caudovirales phage]